MFIQLSIDRHLGCFHILAIVYNAAVNIEVHIFFWISVFHFFGQMPRSRIGGSNFWRISILSLLNYSPATKVNCVYSWNIASLYAFFFWVVIISLVILTFQKFWILYHIIEKNWSLGLVWFSWHLNAHISLSWWNI